MIKTYVKSCKTEIIYKNTTYEKQHLSLYTMCSHPVLLNIIVVLTKLWVFSIFQFKRNQISFRLYIHIHSYISIYIFRYADVYIYIYIWYVIYIYIYVYIENVNL